MTGLLLFLTIHGCPRTKKNSRQCGKNGITRPSKAYLTYAATAYHQITAGRLDKPIAEPVTVKALYYMNTHGIVDKVGLEQGLHDLLVDRGILADDNSRIIVSTDGSRVLYDRMNPRTEVTITRYML